MTRADELADVIATIENMRAHHQADVFAFSPLTGEECSSDPADHFLAPAGWTIRDAEGEPMVLVRRVSFLVPVGTEVDVTLH